ncbi:glycoside hydrolase family 3 N-terminal domain-containing protein [Microbacterium sp. QXD-8]|uniref:Glycoside hydrolase family 3 N-terminal domain-containing protein n=1 Tax=Microbacterium psychrotolerans TaxID=3068321 RepID=A0ABU0Z624_9MICO|nr:glycoside hydrolase family 3 N-terminal domain-containing protein [Microbacterium sp. QXD-8]MDQ7879468.1 glycoside hydrolase family 3 N-terminal domain-containing protein [Microbacterium sp. QXD-8]
MSAQAGVIDQGRWRDTTLSARERAQALVDELTLEEKVAQLGSVWLTDAADDFAPTLEDGLAPDGADPFAHGLGQLTRVFGTAPVSVREGVARLRELQHRVVASQRLGIPALVHEECLTGLATFGATAFPTPLAWAATFDEDLVRDMARAIGDDMRAIGVHQGLAPVLDVVRDYRWGRVEETLGEDPYVVGQMGAAYVAGLEGAGVVATLKHFAGYAASRAARNHGPVSMGPREFADTVLPPFETALRQGGARSVMTSYTDVDGIPSTANRQLLDGVLRTEWGFDGTVVADYWAVPFLVSMHRVAADGAAAGALALRAGVDVELPSTVAYAALPRLVREGVVDESDIDRAAVRHLRHKIEAGLLDRGPVVPDGAEDVLLDSPRNRAISAALAEESIILLRDDGMLPLTGARRIALIGPAATEYRSLLGCYAFPNHVLTKYPGHAPGIDIPTIEDAVRAEWGDARVRSERGCEIVGDAGVRIDEAVALARHSDVAVLVVGDVAGLFGAGTSGEGCDAPHLRLPGRQDDLVRAVLATGTPTVLVVVSGRPYALGDYAEAGAIVQAFFPGADGAAAVAGVLSGRIAPSGRLPVQIPRSAEATGTYLQPPLGRHNRGITVADPTPLFPFGHGVTPGRIVYESIETPAVLSTGGAAEVAVVVRNDGADAIEVVQLYASFPSGPIVRPDVQLVGFARIPVPAGARRTVRFTLEAARLAATGPDSRLAVEPGVAVLSAGPSAAERPAETRVRLAGPRRVLLARAGRTAWDVDATEAKETA